MKKTKDTLITLGSRILSAVKRELYLSMPYLARAMGTLSEAMDQNTFTVGTDGVSIRYNTRFLSEIYLNFPTRLNRIYMHMLLHNLLMHPFYRAFSFDNEDDEELWQLACEISVESIIDSMDMDCMRMVTSDFREKWYKTLSNEIRSLTDTGIYRYFKEHPPYGDDWLKLKDEFCMDDHSFWMRRDNDDDSNEIENDFQLAPFCNLPLKEIWEKAANAINSEVELSGAKAMSDSGRLTWNLKLRHTAHRDYHKLLEKYMIPREVCRIDPEYFDIAYYQYGMKMYGDMPLIEELEGREEKRIFTLIIAIDTSASTRRKHVIRFLNETVAILRQSEYFFESVNLHIIECDEHVQRDIELTKPGQIEEYARDFTVSGGYGTDFRPVFSYVDDLRKKGGLPGLSALLYFTDGYGIYPTKATDYDTAFIFIEDEDYDDTNVPSWAVKVYL